MDIHKTLESLQEQIKNCEPVQDIQVRQNKRSYVASR